METADYLLFEKIYDGKPLFSSQVELVIWLLTTYQSNYYTDPADHIEYNKNVNRLKAYISQLLSGGVARNVTSVFRNSFEIVLRQRLVATDYDAGEVAAKILQDLDNRNKKMVASGAPGRDFSAHAMKELFMQLTQSTDILVITGRPVDVQTDQLSLQQYMVFDFIQSLIKPENVRKKYRFNFPHRQMADLFWYSLKKAIETNLLQILSSEKQLDHFYLNSHIHHSLYYDLKDKKEYSKDILSTTANSVIRHLNMEALVSVYVVDEPIFSLPMVVLQPDSRHATAYVILESDTGPTSINRLCRDDLSAWRFAVWERLKTRSAGQPIHFPYNHLH